MLMAGLDRLDQGITLFGPDLKLVFANSRLVELVGLPPQRCHAGPVGTLLRVRGDELDDGLREFDALVLLEEVPGLGDGHVRLALGTPNLLT